MKKSLLSTVTKTKKNIKKKNQSSVDFAIKKILELKSGEQDFIDEFGLVNVILWSMHQMEIREAYNQGYADGVLNMNITQNNLEKKVLQTVSDNILKPPVNNSMDYWKKTFASDLKPVVEKK